MNYWNIIKWDKEVVKIKPEYVDIIKAKLESGGGFIETPGATISVKDIKEFSESSEPYTDQKLIEDASRAFNEPVINEDGSVQARWVKKSVSRRQYEKFYQYSPGYRKIGEADSHVMVAWKQPTHQIDHQTMQELTPDELLKIK